MDVQPTSHRCGQCNDEWLTEAEYLAHLCPATNATPAQPEHQGAEFVAVQRAALERGLERAQAEGNGDQVVRQQEAIQQLPTE